MSEWIKWNGGERPVIDNALVDVKFGGGSTVLYQSAGNLYWQYTGKGGHGDIIAYRLSETQSMEEAYEQAHKPISDSALDEQVAGTHYKKLKIQPVTYIHANNIGFMEGSAIKYLSRWRDKGGVDDLQKAKHFIEMLIELEGK